MSDTELMAKSEPVRRLEIFTGAGRRRAWSAEQKAQIVAESSAGREQLIREGKITYVGSSNFAGWDIATAQRTGASRNRPGLASASTKAAKAREADVAMCCIHERARGQLSISRPN
jgi:aryl-alcohol dehydrogenase-like predicted oxidoreductase